MYLYTYSTYICTFMYLFNIYIHVNNYKCNYLYCRIQLSCSLAPLLHTHTHTFTNIHMRYIRSALSLRSSSCFILFRAQVFPTQSAPFRKKRIENQIENDSSSPLLVNVMRTFICMCALVFSEAVTKKPINTLSKNIWCFCT